MRKVHSFYSCAGNLSHLGLKKWRLVPHEIAQSVSLGDLKSKILDSSWFFLQTTKNTFTSNSIYLKNLTLSSLTAVSPIIIFVFNI